MILQLIWSVVELLALGGAGLFLYGDYKKGFPVTQSLYEKGCQKFKQLTGQKEDVIAKVDRLVAGHARNIALLRDSVATIEANVKQTARRLEEQKLLAQDFEEVELEAARSGDEEALTVAAVARVETEKRVGCFAGHIGEQQKILEILRRQLDVKEMEFDTVKTRAETAKVVYQITQAKKQLYLMTSSIGTETGLTVGGQFEQLLLSTEHEDLKTDSLLEMAQRSSHYKINQFRQQMEVRKEIEAVKQRIALPAAPTEIEAAKNQRTIEEEIEAEAEIS